MTPNSIVQKALEDVQQELVIEVDGERHLVYIMSLRASDNGKIEIDWALPYGSDDYELKEMLFNHVQAAIKAQIEEYTKCQSNKPFYRILSLMKSIFGRPSRT